MDGNIEFSEKNLIEAEALYRKSISKDSTNIAASYNLANSFYNKELNQEALNQYRSSIKKAKDKTTLHKSCLLYTSPSPRDRTRYRMPSSA